MRFFHLLVLFAVPMGILAHPALAQEIARPPLAAEVAEKVMPAVVQVVTEVEYSIEQYAWHESAFKKGEWIKETSPREFGQKVTIRGSGSVIFSGDNPLTEKPECDSYVLTNWHVIQYALPNAARWIEDWKKERYTFDGYLPVLPEELKKRPDYQVTINQSQLGLVVLPNQNGLIPAKPVWWDKNLDAALLRIENVCGVPTVSLGRSGDVKVGDRIFLAGAPLGIPFAFTEGRLSQKNLDIDDSWKDLWRVDLAIQPGSSGSAIFNEEGKVVAIVRGSFVASLFVPVGLEGQHLAIPIDNIKFLLRWNGYSFLLGEDDIINRWRERKYGGR